jgi:16S rRNA processing protein RimM
LGKQGKWRAYRLLEGKVHGQTVLASLEGVSDRNVAEAMQGFEVAVERSALPEPAEDEYYWDQLTGLEVVNLQGEVLGRVTGLMETGAHEVLKVSGEYESKPIERLIPFVAALVQTVDLEAKRIVVDWGLDY